MTDLPEPVEIDPGARVVDYWRARAAQSVDDSYAGVRLCKLPEDLHLYEHLLWLSAPDTVIELGAFAGGSTLWLRDRLVTLANYGRLTRTPRVIAVDIDVAAARAAVSSSNADGRIVMIEGQLEDPAIVERVARHVGERCMVIEDSAHTYESTLAALEGYAGLVTPSCYMVVEDGIVDDEDLRLPEWPRGVRPALDAWLATDAGSRFVVRRDLELYGVTCAPAGILQRTG